jgi:hypothetical protein
MRPAQCDATAAALSLDGRLHRLLVAFLGSVRIGTLSSKPGPRLGLIDAIEVRATYSAPANRAQRRKAHASGRCSGGGELISVKAMSA